MKRLAILREVGAALAGLDDVTVLSSRTVPVETAHGHQAAIHYSGPESWSWDRPWTPDRKRPAAVEQTVVVVCQVGGRDEVLQDAEAALFQAVVQAIAGHGPLWSLIDPIHGGLSAVDYDNQADGAFLPGRFQVSMRFTYRDSLT